MSNPLLRHLKIVAPFNPMERVVVTDVEALCRKIGRIKNDGIRNLQIVSDFDYTLTRFNTYGVPSKTSVTIAQVVNQTDQRKAEVEKLIQYYSPIEHSNLISKSFKAKYMKEWWYKSSSMLISDQLKDQDIENLVLNSQVYLRHGIEAILDLCKSNSIHFTVVSAGFGNIVSKFFEILSFRDSVEIFSNFLLPDSQGKLVRRTEPIIVSIEKNNVLVGKTRKENFIILGDMASVYFI
jgi:5'-nucleotidase